MPQTLTLFETEDDLWALVNSEGMVPTEQEEEFRRELTEKTESGR
jgi:hypothetical protein